MKQNKILFLMISVILLLSACSAPAVVSQTAAVPPSTENRTVEPVGTAVSEPTDAGIPVEAATQPANPPSSGIKTFTIVPSESKVAYEVAETFINQNNRFNLAVGVTNSVNGTIQANLQNPPASTLGEFTIDISQFTSDSSRRDNAIRNNWLESARFPTAVFKPTSIAVLPGSYEEGKEYTFQVTGDLTVKQTTRPVTFDVTAKLSGDTLSGKATTTILLSDFNVGPISILGVLKTEDQAKLTLEFVARP